ncbi:hypothetical protein GCM10027405_01920 [Arthrobacter alkaliphilus]
MVGVGRAALAVQFCLKGFTVGAGDVVDHEDLEPLARFDRFFLPFRFAFGVRCRFLDMLMVAGNPSRDRFDQA